MRITTLLMFSLFFALDLSAQSDRIVENQARTVYSTSEINERYVFFMQEAERHYRNLEMEAAILALDNAVGISPEAVDALLLRAKYKTIMGRKREAAQDIAMVNRLNPYAADLFGFNGAGGILNVLAIQREDYFDQLNTFQKLNYYYQEIDERFLNKNKEEEEYLLLVAAIREIESENLSEAQSTLDTLLIRYPDSPIGHDLRGVVFALEERWNEATKSFKKAVALQPGFDIAWYNLGRVQNSVGNYLEAKKYLDKAIELEPTLTKAYFERALVWKNLGETRRAVEDYDRVIEMTGKTYFAAYWNRGLTKKGMGDYSGALADMTIILDEYPDEAEWYNDRGNLHFLFGAYTKAIYDYTEAIRLQDDFAEAYYNRGLAEILIHQKVAAKLDLERSKELGFAKAADKITYFSLQ